MNMTIILTAVVLVIAALGYAGNSDYEAAKAEQDIYCEMVASKAWPDYNNNYKEICK